MQRRERRTWQQEMLKCTHYTRNHSRTHTHTFTHTNISQPTPCTHTIHSPPRHTHTHSKRGRESSIETLKVCFCCDEIADLKVFETKLFENFQRLHNIGKSAGKRCSIRTFAFLQTISFESIFGSGLFRMSFLRAQGVVGKLTRTNNRCPTPNS